ncbi:glycosyltransferase family 25 protein [Acinetobacter sp. ANC 5502]
MSKSVKVLFVCISLKQSTSRRENVLNELQKLRECVTDVEIDFKFFDAIYGKDLAPEYLSFINIAREQARQCKRPLGPGEIGCLLSHMFIWQRQIDGHYDSYNRVIILEDDVYLNTNKINEKILDISQSTEDFIFLGGHTLQSRTRIHGYPSKNQLFFKMLGPSDLYTTTCAYSVTAKTAKLFLNKLISKPTYVDDWKYLLKYRFITPYYFCFEQGGKDDSNINVDRIKNKNIKKPNRLHKNLNKILHDFIARLKILITLRKNSSLASFLKNNREDGYTD